MKLPTIHLNGSSRDRLEEDNALARQALARAIETLEDAAPNARDYYPQGDDAYRVARAEHVERVRRLQSVMKELQEIAGHLGGLS